MAINKHVHIMSLGRKAFPGLGEKQFDRLLKGRFFQALLPRWQRKLGAPKVEESFDELYQRARITERHDQHYNSRWPQNNSRRKQFTKTDDDMDVVVRETSRKIVLIRQTEVKQQANLHQDCKPTQPR